MIGAGAGAVAGAITIGIIDTGEKIGSLIWNMANDGTPRTNTAQNKQFNDAVRQAERETGKKMSQDQIQRLHREVSKQDYSFKEIVEAAKDILPAAAVGAAAAGSSQDAQAAQGSGCRR